MILTLKYLVLVSQFIIIFLSYRVSFLPTTLRKIHRSSIGAFPLEICPSGFLDFTFEIVPLHHPRVIDDPDVPPIKSENEFQSQIWDPGIPTFGIENNEIRLPILPGEKKSNFDYPLSESLANGGVGEAAGTSRDLSRGEAIVDRSVGQDLGGSVATGTNTIATQRRTRKVATSKSEKARWKRFVRMFAKQIGVFFILAGLIQLTRKMFLKASSPSSPISSFETEMVFAVLESRIAKVDGLVMVTTNTMPFHVELLDKMMEREAKAVRQTIRLWLVLFVFVALQPLSFCYAHTKEIQVQIVNLNYLLCLWYKHQPRHEPLVVYGCFLATYLNSSAGSAICQSLWRRQRLWAIKEKMMHFFYYHWIWYFLLICIVRHFFCYGNLAGIIKYFGYRRHDPEPLQATYWSIRLIRVMRKAFRSFIYKMIACYKYMRRGLNRFYLLPVRLLLESRVTSTSSSKLGFNFLYLFQRLYLNGFMYHVSCKTFME